jgi:hypothetical protein
MKRRTISIALLILIAAALACGAPDSDSGQGGETPVPTVTPFLPSDGGDTPDEETTEPTEEASAAPTETSTPPTTPTETPTPTPPPPTATPEPVSTGPLDFVPPTWPENYQPLANGNMQVTLRIEISGGAPPFVVYHDQAIAVETSDRNPTIVFEHGGCSAIVHTITVESADGQSVVHDYWIPPPWCITPES